MSLYAIGDLQGCLDPLKRLLDKIGFDPAHDELWFTGDLINRGPDSLNTLRLLRQLGDRARCVLGNHDFHLIRAGLGLEAAPEDGTLDAILQSPERETWIEWLRHQPLLLLDHERRLAMVHAGLLPKWDLATAATLAGEIEMQLRTDNYREFLKHIYGDTPDRWSEQLSGADRYRTIINAMTRMRFCDRHGRMALKYKCGPGAQSQEFHPWFEIPHRRDTQYTVIFGHWSALGFVQRDGVLGLDTGCVWGGNLTAFRLDPERPERISVAC